MQTIKVTIPKPADLYAESDYITAEAVFCDDSCQVRFLNPKRKLIRLNSPLHTYLLEQFNKVCKNWHPSGRNGRLSPDLSLSGTL